MPRKSSLPWRCCPIVASPTLPVIWLIPGSCFSNEGYRHFGTCTWLAICLKNIYGSKKRCSSTEFSHSLIFIYVFIFGGREGWDGLFHFLFSVIFMPKPNLEFVANEAHCSQRWIYLFSDSGYSIYIYIYHRQYQPPAITSSTVYLFFFSVYNGMSTLKIKEPLWMMPAAHVQYSTALTIHLWGTFSEVLQTHYLVMYHKTDSKAQRHGGPGQCVPMLPALVLSRSLLQLSIRKKGLQCIDYLPLLRGLILSVTLPHKWVATRTHTRTLTKIHKQSCTYATLEGFAVWHFAH